MCFYSQACSTALIASSVAGMGSAISMRMRSNSLMANSWMADSVSLLDIGYKISSPACGGSPPLRFSKASAASRLPRFARS